MARPAAAAGCRPRHIADDRRRTRARVAGSARLAQLADCRARCSRGSWRWSTRCCALRVVQSRRARGSPSNARRSARSCRSTGCGWTAAGGRRRLLARSGRAFAAAAAGRLARFGSRGALLAGRLAILARLLRALRGPARGRTDRACGKGRRCGRACQQKRDQDFTHDSDLSSSLQRFLLLFR